MPPKQKALEKREQLEAEREQKAAAAREAAEAAAWSEGAKDSKKAKAMEDKEAERLRKANEKAQLLAEEEAQNSAIKTGPKTKKKGKDDFDILSASLAAAPKTKAQKEKEEKKRQAEERARAEQEARAQKEERLKAEQEHIRKMAAKGIVVNHTDDLFVPIDNHLDEDDIGASGIDAAIDVLDINGGAEASTNQKALYYAYYERKLPELREEMPGLKLSQYKERIFDMWKTSPENPRNVV